MTDTERLDFLQKYMENQEICLGTHLYGEVIRFEMGYETIYGWRSTSMDFYNLRNLIDFLMLQEKDNEPKTN